MKKKIEKTPEVHTAIYMGVAPQSIDSLGGIILQVLGSNAGDAVKIAAIESLAAKLQVNGSTIHDCNFQMKA